MGVYGTIGNLEAPEYTVIDRICERDFVLVAFQTVRMLNCEEKNKIHFSLAGCPLGYILKEQISELAED